MRRAPVVAAWLALFAGGCGGHYILTVPDQLSEAKGQAVPVVRLQRNDFFVLDLASRKEPLIFRVREGLPGDTLPEQAEWGQIRSTHTDKLGYASVPIDTSEPPMNGRPGVYTLRVSLQDSEGDEIAREAPLFLWDPAKPVVAIDIAALPSLGYGTHDEVVAALTRMSRNGVNLLYLTRQENLASERDGLLATGLPPGPVLLWQRERWHIVRDAAWRVPRVVVETRLINQLTDLKVRFPHLQAGVAGSNLAADAYRDAGVEAVSIDRAVDGATSLGSWQALSARFAPPAAP